MGQGVDCVAGRGDDRQVRAVSRQPPALSLDRLGHRQALSDRVHCTWMAAASASLRLRALAWQLASRSWRSPHAINQPEHHSVIMSARAACQQEETRRRRFRSAHLDSLDVP
eukprot:3584279-Rhodomonas_salina.2